MKRRTLAFLCALALLVGMLPAGAASVVSAEAATGEETYQVGYAIKNFNPWVADTFDVSTDVGTAVFLENPEGTENKKIYPSLFSQNGNQIDWDSVVTDLHDDNGDGKVDHNDGIFATCTAVTYGKGTADEKTILFITTDTMKAWTSLVTEVRNKIVASDWGKELGITADQIMVCSNHTHSGPPLTSLSGFVNSYIDSTVFDTTETIAALKVDRENYYNWVVDRIVAAAEESVGDQAPATMSKGSVNATEATAALNYNGGEGYHMNAIRHYQRTISASLLWWSGSLSSIYANSAVPNDTKLEAQLEEYDHDAQAIFKYGGSYTTSWSTTDEADNTMYVLRFEFEDEDKDPVVFVNWRAHSTMNSGILDHSILSGDYATGLRKVLGDEGYRAAFFQGAAGNVVPHPVEGVYTVSGKLQKDKMDWLYEATDKATSPTLDETKKTFIYGKMLAEVAQYCMEETDANGNSYMTDTPVGEIETYSTSWKAENNKYDQELLDAALALRAEVMSAKSWDEATFESNYRVLFQQYQDTYFPYYYKPNGSTTAIINSRLHFNTVYAQAKLTTVPDYTSAVELDAIMLGEKVAFITSPNELADYYHDFEADNDVVSHTSADKEAHNDWLKLNDDTYGMPFLLGYANQNSGYIANWLDFQANSTNYSTITGLAADGYMLYSPGTYESMTSSFAVGQGEALIEVYDKMLSVVSGEYDIQAPCPHCSPDEDVTWKPLFAENGAETNWVGHYYLVEDLPRFVDSQTQKTFTAGDVLCLNLNGYALETEGRSFNVAKNVEVSIFNTPFENPGTGGVIRSYSEDNNPGGGTVSVASGGIFNLYGGTMEFVKEDDAKYGTGVGGVFSLTGTLNMYGGTIKGAELVDSSYVFGTDGCGGAIYMYGGAVLNVYGGNITSGTLPTTNDLPTAGATLTAAGPCVYASAATAYVNLYNNANVEDIFFRYNNGKNFTISGTYTGTTNLSFHSSISLDQDLDIGNAANSADISGATISFTDTVKPWKVVVNGSNLLLDGYKSDTVAAIGTTEYSSLQGAVDAYNSTIIKMIRDEENAVVVDEGKDIYLDLNGFSVKGAVTVNGNYTLYCKDSKTDDYTVSDGKYGRIKAVAGNVKGIPEASTMADDGYLKVTETDGVSFHRVNLDLTAMTLRVNEVDGVVDPSVYYKSNFMGDEKVAARVTKYGVALSVKEMPNETNLDEKCEYSVYTTFKSGSAGNSGNGTLLKGILKPTNAALINNRNAKTGVFGRAYIETAEGYMFGGGYERSLKDQTEKADGQWSTMTDAQKESVVNMYNAYTSVMKNWTLTNLLTAMGPTQDGALKVLVIGNSHGLDATNLLYEVFEDQGYTEQDLVLGALYYSGCNMTQHATFMTNNQAVYSYYENDGSNADGSWDITENTVADTALNAHQWDIIILQQMNHRAAYDSTASDGYNASDFNTVINYVKARQIGMPKFGWHMVWTNPDGEEYLDPDSSLSHPTKTNTNWVDTHKEWFPDANGNYDQSVMYEGIVACTQKYIEGDVSFLGSDVFDFVIPSATAVEYAQDVLGLTQAQVYRDYTHMNDYGRLIAAYTWYAKIMELDQIPAVGIDAIPTVLHHAKSAYPTADSGYAVTDDMKKLIRNAVNYALDNPYELPSEDDNTVSILGIGNSYTIDSMWMLGEVYQAENPGKTVKLGIAYKSGESLAGHVTNLTDNTAVYNYLYWDTDSDKWTVAASKMTLQDIIKAQEWEMVSMQQGSSGSGRPTTYNADIQTIQSYVETQLGYVPTYLWNMTWAYPEADIEDSYTLENAPNATSFKNYYGSSQATMYKAIVDAVQQKILPNATFEYLMPVGTAVQNANGTLTDYDLYRDYTHLSDFSRLMAAYTWYSELELTVLDDLQLKALPTVNCSSTSWYNGSARDLTSEELALAIQCVKDAMLDNFATTDASVYE